MGDSDEQKPQDLTSPLPQPQTQTCSSLRARGTAPLARGLRSSSAAALQGLTGTVPPSPALPHRRFLRLSGLARPPQAPPRWGRGRHGAAQGPFSLLRPCNGVRRLFRKQGPCTGARPGPPGQPSDPTRQRGSRASLPIPGVPQPPPAPAACSPPFCAQPLRHRYNSRPGPHRRGSGAPRYGLPPCSPLLPPRLRSYLCLPD